MVELAVESGILDTKRSRGYLLSEQKGGVADVGCLNLHLRRKHSFVNSVNSPKQRFLKYSNSFFFRPFIYLSASKTLIFFTYLRVPTSAMVSFLLRQHRNLWIVSTVPYLGHHSLPQIEPRLS